MKLVAEGPEPSETQSSVEEKRYHCWQEVPLDAGNIVSRTQSIPWFVAPVTEPTLQENRNANPETYLLDLESLGLPETLSVSYCFNLDAAVSLLEQLENLKIPKEIKLPWLRQAADEAAKELASIIKQINNSDLPNKETVPTITPTDTLPLDWHLQHLYQTGFVELESAFPSGLKPSEVLKAAKSNVTAFAEKTPDGDIKNRIAKAIGQDASFLPDRVEYCRSALPIPANYFDDWETRRIVGGKMPAAVVIGEIPSHEYAGMDLDASASLKLVKMISDATVVSGEARPGDRVLKESEVYAPPNMTNLYITGVPLVSFPQYGDTHRSEREDGFMRIIFCEDPERLNPDNFAEILDKRFGHGSWILVGHSKNSGKLVRFVPLPKDKWSVDSVQRRDTLIGIYEGFDKVILPS